MRESVKGFPLFKVTFKRLRDATDDEVESVLCWYQETLGSQQYKDLRKLYKENTMDYWLGIQSRSKFLPEYKKLQYLLQAFVALAKRTMPEIIKPDGNKPVLESENT